MAEFHYCNAGLAGGREITPKPSLLLDIINDIDGLLQPVRPLGVAIRDRLGSCKHAEPVIMPIGFR